MFVFRTKWPFWCWLQCALPFESEPWRGATSSAFICIYKLTLSYSKAQNRVNVNNPIKAMKKCFSFVRVVASHLFLALPLFVGVHAVLAQPSLSIAPAGGQVVLIWPAAATNYCLQSATNLITPNWLTVSNTVPVTVGDAVNVTINSDSFAMFFRLCLNTNVPVSTVSYTNAIAYFYGDSVTEGYNPNPPYTNLASRFPALLCTNFAMIESNNGVGGSQIADLGEADMIETNNAIYGTNVSVWLAGYNDVFYYGTNAAALDDNEAALESLAAWLAIPTSVRVPCNNTNNWNTWHNPGVIYYDPGWGFYSTLGGSAYSTQTGNSASFFFSGNTLLIGTARVASNGGVETVVVGDIDQANNLFIPTATNTYSCIRTSANTATARSYSPGLIIFTNLSNAAIHGAILTAQSAAKSGSAGMRPIPPTSCPRWCSLEP